MSLSELPLVPDVLLVVVAPALVAAAGAGAALRRAPGRWRTLLLVGLALAGLVPALWWWSPWMGDTGVLTSTTGGWFGYDEAGFDTFARALWIEQAMNVAQLAGFSAIVAVAVAGLDRRVDAGPHPD
ncbi:MAG TPA: hypothetical protein VFL10_13830 [Ornithinibacter sp.]|nr:hypothetical protein [Ornithinibacter sp.]